MAANQEDVLDNLNQAQAGNEEMPDKTPDPDPGDVTPPDGDTKPDDKSGEEGNSAVPYAALKAERVKWQKRMEGMEEKLSKYDQLQEKLNQFYENQQVKEQQSKIPDYDENPAEFLRLRQEELEAGQAKINENLSEYDKQREKQVEAQRIGQTIQADENRFLKEKPDYYKALQFVRDKELERLKLSGIDDVQAMQTLGSLEYQIASQLANQQQSPAEYIYNIANWYGYKNEDAQAAEDKIDQLEQGMQASKTLGSGASPQLGDMAKMPMAEFDVAMKEMFG